MCERRCPHADHRTSGLHVWQIPITFTCMCRRDGAHNPQLIRTGNVGSATGACSANRCQNISLDTPEPDMTENCLGVGKADCVGIQVTLRCATLCPESFSRMLMPRPELSMCSGTSCRVGTRDLRSAAKGAVCQTCPISMATKHL